MESLLREGDPWGRLEKMLQQEDPTVYDEALKLDSKGHSFPLILVNVPQTVGVGFEEYMNLARLFILNGAIYDRSGRASIKRICPKMTEKLDDLCSFICKPLILDSWKIYHENWAATCVN